MKKKRSGKKLITKGNTEKQNKVKEKKEKIKRKIKITALGRIGKKGSKEIK